MDFETLSQITLERVSMDFGFPCISEGGITGQHTGVVDEVYSMLPCDFPPLGQVFHDASLRGRTSHAASEY